MTGEPSRAGALPTASALLLAAWLGAVTLFGAVVAPTLFDVLPSRALAGAVVARVLPTLFLAGVAAGALAAAAAIGGRTRRSRARLVGGLVTASMCAVGQFGIGARLERVRARARPSLEALPPDHPLRADFGRLHALSVAALGVAALAAGATAAATPLGRRAAEGA